MGGGGAAREAYAERGGGDDEEDDEATPMTFEEEEDDDDGREGEIIGRRKEADALPAPDCGRAFAAGLWRALWRAAEEEEEAFFWLLRGDSIMRCSISSRSLVVEDAFFSDEPEIDSDENKLGFPRTSVRSSIPPVQWGPALLTGSLKEPSLPAKKRVCGSPLDRLC